MTSGASDEPPMPASTIRSRPSARSSADSASISASSGREVSCRSVQPNRMDASASASGPYSVASFAAMREATCSDASFSTASGQLPEWTVTASGSLVTSPPPPHWSALRSSSSLRRLQLPRGRLQQLVPTRLELLDTFTLEHGDDVVEVDAHLGQPGHRLSGVVVVGAHGVAGDLTVIDRKSVV